MSTGTSPHIDFEGSPVTQNPTRIRRLEDLPNLQTMDIKPVDYLVPGLISRGSLTMWAGVPGAAKSYLILRLAIALATGGEFLGRRCQKCKVLILDYENPAHEVRHRLDLMTCETVIPDLYIWGIWNEQDPPRIGSDLLMTIAGEEKPVIIFDPFRNAHGSDENDSTEMTSIMQLLTDLKKRGATVIFAHHPGKGEGATSRGSSAIDGAVDMALVQTLDPDSQLIELRVGKNKIGELSRICIRPDFETGTFEVTDSPKFQKKTADSNKLLEIISETPGLTQNAIVKRSGMSRAYMCGLLRDGLGTFWDREEGPNKSFSYYPRGWFSESRTTDRTTVPLGEQGASGSGGLPLKGVEPPNHRALTPCSSNNLSGSEQLCAIHGWHTTWAKPNGHSVCLRCHPPGGAE